MDGLQSSKATPVTLEWIVWDVARHRALFYGLLEKNSRTYSLDMRTIVASKIKIRVKGSYRTTQAASAAGGLQHELKRRRATKRGFPPRSGGHISGTAHLQCPYYSHRVTAIQLKTRCANCDTLTTNKHGHIRSQSGMGERLRKRASFSDLFIVSSRQQTCTVLRSVNNSLHCACHNVGLLQLHEMSAVQHWDQQSIR